MNRLISALGGLALCGVALCASPGAAAAATFPLDPGQNMIFQLQVTVTHQHDTLPDIARAYDLGYTQLVAANRDVDPWLPGERTPITLPIAYLLPEGPRKGIVVNLVEERVYYFPPGGREVETFPIGVGVEGRATPQGTTRVIAKQPNPTWYPPPSIRAEKPELPAAVPPGPDNPLGAFAFKLGWPSYLIHGTNKPFGVGRNSSHGCIRLYPEDMALLFSQVPVGTPVRVLEEEAKLAWVDGMLFLEVHPNKAQALTLEVTGRFEPATIPGLAERITRLAGTQAGRVDWEAVHQAERERTGIPLRILTPAEPVTAAGG